MVCHQIQWYNMHDIRFRFGITKLIKTTIDFKQVSLDILSVASFPLANYISTGNSKKRIKITIWKNDI